MDTKITKKDVLTAIVALVAEDANVTVNDVVVTGEDIRNFAQKTMEQIDAKAAKAKEKAAEKKAEGDALRNAIEAVLTDEVQTLDQILEQVDFEDVTKAKITARLTQLIKAGRAYKVQVKLENGKKAMAYAAGSEPVAEAE